MNKIGPSSGVSSTVNFWAHGEGDGSVLVLFRWRGWHKKKSSRLCKGKIKDKVGKINGKIKVQRRKCRVLVIRVLILEIYLQFTVCSATHLPPK